MDETYLNDYRLFAFTKSTKILRSIIQLLENNKLTSNYALRNIAHDTMNLFKEQTGKVDKTFVAELEKQYKETPTG